MKNMILAAAAATMLVAPALATPVSIQRQTFLENGVAPTSLNREETVQVQASGSVAAYSCSLVWDGAGPDANQLASPAPGNTVPDATVAGTTTAFSLVAGTLLLVYNGRINPQDMAVGNAFYEGDSEDTALTGTVNLGCPAGGSVTLGYRAPTPGTPTFVEDTACREARKAFVDAHNALPENQTNNLGYAYGLHCPDIEVPGTGDPGDPGTAFTYQYVAPATTGLLTVTSVNILY